MTVLIDSNVWIFSNIQEYPEHNTAVEKIRLSEKNGIVINDIIFSEVYHKLSILLKSRFVAKDSLEKILNSAYVFFTPIEKQVLSGALEISASKLMRINDSIIAQQCLENNWEILTDNDKDFSRIDGLRIISLR